MRQGSRSPDLPAISPSSRGLVPLEQQPRRLVCAREVSVSPLARNMGELAFEGFVAARAGATLERFSEK